MFNWMSANTANHPRQVTGRGRGATRTSRPGSGSAAPSPSPWRRPTAASSAAVTGTEGWGLAAKLVNISKLGNVQVKIHQGNGMDIESRTCKYFARKRTRSKYVAGRVVNMLPHFSLPRSGISIFCSIRQGWFNISH